MAAGVKIATFKREHRGKTIVLRDHRRFLVKHNRPKEYQLRFDGEGITIVSETVWARLAEMLATFPSLPRLIVVGYTRRPPKQRVTGLEPVYLSTGPDFTPPKTPDARHPDALRHAGKEARPVLVFEGGGVGQGPAVPVDQGLVVTPRITLS